MENTQVLESNKKKKGLIIALVVVAAIALIVAFCIIMFGKNYEKVLEENIGIVNEHQESNEKFNALTDIGGLAEAYKSFDALAGDGAQDPDSFYKVFVEALEEQYGTDYKVSYEMGEARKFRRSECDKVKEGISKSLDEITAFVGMMEEDTALYSTYFGVEESEIETAISAMKTAFEAVEESKVTAAYEVTVKFKIAGSKGEDEFEHKIVFAKIDGEWRMLEEEEGVYNTFTINPAGIMQEVVNK